MSRNRRSEIPPTMPPAECLPCAFSFGPDDYPTHGDIRKSAPFQPGSVVWVEGYKLKDGKQIDAPRKALVLDVFSHYLERRMERIPKYRVAFSTLDKATRQMRWSKNWEYTYPGMIQRGYEQAEKASVKGN